MLRRIDRQHFLEDLQLQQPRETDQHPLNRPPRVPAKADKVALRVHVVPYNADIDVIPRL